ncbi:thioesterase family protein [Ruminiclostridium herbifermentans]|uniref:Thioesterase family protein n=1 Tax=Ruminiclostridium herbifermentans TaxID=2488810 RepID=A0A4U7JKT0_9FIRM|nr:thioesterase family protein [Ruminiclostridium herbifermentans]QNU68681.1 thioesterase family protein [Ruminiclostridium herbifermentans]
MDFKIGMEGIAQTTVNSTNTAKEMGSGDLEVFATPAMVSLMEKAATIAIQGCLSKEYSTVGTMINIRHIAATPLGMNVSARATLTEVDGKKLIFTVEAFDEREKIGEGQHERYVINVERFMDKTNRK